MDAMISEIEVTTNAAANAKREMKRRGLSYRKLSQITGEPIGTLHRVMSGTGEPGISIIAKLAEAFDTTVDALLSSPKKSRKKTRTRANSG